MLTIEKIILPFIIALLICIFIPPLPANGGFIPNIKPTLELQKINGKIVIDGKLDEPAWSNAAKATNFSETRPGDMTQPPVETEALLTYDEANLYIAFIAHDDPSEVRVSICERDAIWQDDNVGILFDTYGDAAWAYEILTNPVGIQGDLRWTNNGDEDSGFDIVFYSIGVVTDSGYQVEMAIPFKSLRFPDKPAQTWRATLWRNQPRAIKRQFSWAAIAKDTPGFTTQFGVLTGMENVRPGRDISFIPAVTAYQSSAINDSDDPHSGLARGHGEGRLSLTGKYSLSTSSTIEATWRPDFSQVESDAAQIDVNTTYALFYSEARPFFQEGADLFSMPITSFYSRSINDPRFAAKFIGRMSRASIAYVGARDMLSPIILPFEEGSEFLLGGKSTTSVLRFKRTIQEDSHIGGLATLRNYAGGGSGFLGGFDGTVRLWERYKIGYQVLLSQTKEPNDSALTADIEQETFDTGRHTAGFDGESYWGEAATASFSRDAKHWNFSLSYNEKSPTFRADNGFVTGNSTRQLDFWNGRIFYFDKSWITQLTPSFDFGHVRNYNGTHKDIWFVPELSAQLTGQTYIALEYLWSAERFHDILFKGIRRGSIDIESGFSKNISLNFEIGAGWFIARNLDPPVLGNGLNIGASATIRPVAKLAIVPAFEFAKLDYPDGSNIFRGYISRARFNYQVSRELMTRLVIQYDDFDRNLSVEPLIRYQLNPFSIFYIGASHGYDKYDDTDGLTTTSEQYFMKFQYLIGL